MIVELPDAEVRGTGLTSQWAKIEVAVGLYRERKVSLGRAARLAGLSSPEFLREAGRRGATVNYDASDLESDMAALASLD